MSRMGFETTTPAFERAQTVPGLDRAATIFGRMVEWLVTDELETVEVRWSDDI
jgi:hypothetical protein